MLSAPLDWQYEEMPSSARDALLYVRRGTFNQIIIKKIRPPISMTFADPRIVVVGTNKMIVNPW